METAGSALGVMLSDFILHMDTALQVIQAETCFGAGGQIHFVDRAEYVGRLIRCVVFGYHCRDASKSSHYAGQVR